jgi:hypothetical protein
VLRRSVQLIAVAMVLLGLWLLRVGRAPGLQLLLIGLVTFVAVRYESWRKGAAPPPGGPEWQATGERFEDPGTGRTVEVQYNAQTGERRYQPDDPG